MKIMTVHGLHICDVEEGGDLVQAAQNNGWVWHQNDYTFTRFETITSVTPSGETVTYQSESAGVFVGDLRVAEEMHYGEYKRNYSHLDTVKGSYNPQTKTITVLTPL